MIVITGTIPVNDVDRDDLVEALNAMRVATLAEEGCAGYRFAFASDDPNVVIFAEEWSDNTALGAHMQSPHMADLQKALPRFATGKPVMNIYEASSKTVM